jgi:putrescine transport system permease protein
MIGKTLWIEFFNNSDWTVASAIAIILLIVLVVPIVLFQNAQAKSRGGGQMNGAGPGSTSPRSCSAFAFLYLPIVLLVIYSFNESRLVTVWAGFSTKWYVELFSERRADRRRLGDDPGCLALGHDRHRAGNAGRDLAGALHAFRGRTLFTGMVYAPLVMPEVITGLSLLLLFVSIDFARGFWTVTLAHITFSLCFVAVVVQSRLITFDRSFEEAAQDLGCPPFQAFMKVTLPVILPAVISGWMLAFTLSLDDLVIASSPPARAQRRCR